MKTIFVLVFTTLVQNIGPVTTETKFPTMDACKDEKYSRTMAAGDRMMHAHCEGRIEYD